MYHHSGLEAASERVLQRGDLVGYLELRMRHDNATLTHSGHDEDMNRRSLAGKNNVAIKASQIN